jgi:16S rRNA (cytidine1402-2'-O)-methyltransferase
MAKKRKSETSRTAAARAISSPHQIGPEGSDERSISKPSTGAQKDSAPIAGLVIVATPIGNAGDITLRALELLRRADRIACEDTRVTGGLLARYGIATPLLAYHEHNAARMRPLLLERLRRGETIALVSDAAPLVSTPATSWFAPSSGGICDHLPGPSAALAALVRSATDRFFFAGLRAAQLARRTALNWPHRGDPDLLRSAGRLADTRRMAAVLGARDAAVARELTKLYEEVRRGTVTELAKHYAAVDPPKGEIVIVVGPPAAAEASEAVIDDALRAALATLSMRDAVAAVAASLSAPRRRVYARALALAGSKP